MEAKAKKTTVSWEETSDNSGADGYVAPEVAAAEAGEQVEFGKNLSENDPNEQDTATNP